MAIKLASWNIEGRLNNFAGHGRGTPEHILTGIEALDADVLVLPEAVIGTVADGVNDRLKALGYTFIEAPYNDIDREYEVQTYGALYARVLSRLPMDSVEIIRPGDVRDLIVCQMTDPESGKKLRIVATHLDDRSESLRLKQIEELIPYINATKQPTVMLGDFNAMWHVGRARWLHSKMIYLTAKLVPHKELGSMVTRVADMATGTTLHRLVEQTNLREADMRYRPTTTPKMRGILFMPSIRLLQIDHMLVSPGVKVEGFTIGKDGGADHRAISAIIS